MPEARKSVKVFIDSSVLFAAVLSSTGGSFRVFKEAPERNILLLATPYVLSEVAIALQRKYPEYVEYYQVFLTHFPVKIVKNPPASLVIKYLKLLPKEDAPILAAALTVRAEYLLTLDKKHFLSRFKNTRLPVDILTPGDFIKRHF